MYEIKKIKSLNGTVCVPGDKSISHRGIMLGALASGTTEIDGFLMGADCLSTIDCFKKMGIDINIKEKVTVKGKGLFGLSPSPDTLYTGNSGTTTRLLCGILSGQSFNSRITGDASICKRPMKRVTAPLSEMGANIDGDYCPLTIYGSKLVGIDYNMPVASAQVKTAVLLAGLYADGKTTITEKTQSRNHTELMLKAMGADINEDSNIITLIPGNRLVSQHITVPGDISSAAFFMAAAAIIPNSCIKIENVGINPTRTGIIDAFKAMGANITIENQHLSSMEPVADICVCTSELHGTVISGALIPRLIDELPIIAVMAVFAKGDTIIADASELKVKETNRIRAVVNEFKKCGIDIEETDDGMIIHGGIAPHGADFVTYGDHRMAMSLTVLSQMSDGKSTLNDAECVSVSYPGFFNEFYELA